MKRLSIVAVLILGTLLGGCAPVLSLNPLYEEKKKEAVFFEKLVGEWKVVAKQKDSHDDGNTRWIFRRSDKGDGYDLSSLEISRKGSYASEAHIIKLDDKFFLDVEPVELDSEEALGKPIPVLPAHTFARIWIDDHKVRIHFLDDSWLEDQKKVGKLNIAFAEAPTGLVLTATTEQLRKFAIEHADDEAAFALKYELTKLD